MDLDLEIEFDDAEKSIEFERGLAAFLQTSADTKQRLLDIARTEREQTENYRILYLQELAKNAQLEAEKKRLEAENAQLRARPLYNVAGDLVEHQKIGKQIIALSVPQKPKRTKSKTKNIDLTNQLDLWANPALSM